MKNSFSNDTKISNRGTVVQDYIPYGGKILLSKSDNADSSMPDYSVILKHFKANQSKSSLKDTLINKKYLGDSLGDALINTRVLSVLASYGGGKTTSIKKYIQSITDKLSTKNRKAKILFITPRKSLNAAIAGDFETITCYLQVKNEPNKKIKTDLISSMSCTPQSLSSLLSFTGDSSYDLVIFDESETIANMLVSDAVEDKERTLSALKNVVVSSDKVVFMDANYSEDSELLACTLSGLKEIPRLINTYKTWAKIKASIISGGTFENRKTAINTQIIEAIHKGEKIAIASSSAGYAQSIYKVIKERYPDVTVKLATSSTDNQELVNNPDSVSSIDVLIYSPSLSVGISFDLINHFHSVFGVFANFIDTPDSFDAMQMMCRVRSPSLNKWVIALDENKNIYENHGHEPAPNEITALLSQQYIINAKYAVNKSVEITPLQNELLRLYANIEARLRFNKNNYNALFMQKLNDMGIAVQIVPVKSIEANQDIQAQIKEGKKQDKEQAINDLFQAEKITEEENKKLKEKRRYAGLSLTKKESLSLDRFYIENAFNVDFDKLSEEQRAELLGRMDDNYIKKAKNRARLLAPASFDKVLVKARLYGLDNESQSYKKDILDKNQSYLLLKKLDRYALGFIEGNEYSHATLKRTAFYQWVSRNKRSINIISPNMIPANFSAKPALLMNKLLERIGYKHSTIKIKGFYNYSAVIDSSFESFYEEQKARGCNWLEIQEKRIKELDIVSESLTSKIIKNYQMPLAHVNFAKAELLKIPKMQHESILNEYLRQYDVMNPENKHGINCPQFANKWLKKQAEKHEKITA